MLFLFPLLFFHLSLALLEKPFVSFEDGPGRFELQGGSIIYDDTDPIGVEIAAKSLSKDLEQITGLKSGILTWQAALGNYSASSVILAATVRSPLVRWLKKRHKIDTSDVQGRWETFKTFPIRFPLPGVRDGLLVVGSDKRGTMYGVYSLSEQSGQSPFHWWADIPAKQHSKIYALPQSTIHGEPSVKYRGIFINDEAPGLTGWWAARSGNGNYTLDSDFYEHVFDLLLRLKANFLWPAMWASFVPKPGRIFFTDDIRNQQLADDYGIVISTSHHEPMQRATNEWNSETNGEWSWVTNKEAVTRFMEEGVRRAGNNESYFTLGMRGPADGPMDAEDPVSTLKDVFKEQRRLLAKYHGNESAANQVWTIYKEVYTYYAAGLSPPDDVTLMFTDDNWGNVQRLPTESERKRSGGVGLYFHFEYVGNPKSYKWQNTVNLPKTFKELSQAYERGADRIWVMNVGDIKPMEIPLALSMDLAWNISNFSFEFIPQYLKLIAARDFGDELGSPIAKALLQYSHLVGMRKYEMTTPETYSILNFHESERMLAKWKHLADQTLHIQSKIPAELRDGLYHLLVYPVLAGYYYHRVVLGQARNYQYAFERRNSANSLAQEVLDFFDKDYDLVLEYDKMGNGKWKGIMSTPKFDTGVDRWLPPSRDVLTNLSYVQLRQSFDYHFGDLGIYAEGSRSAIHQGRVCASCDPVMPTKGSFSPVPPVMDPYGPQIRTVDLFHRGNYKSDISWKCETPVPWITVTPASGILSGSHLEQRLSISIDWEKVPHGLDKVYSLRVEWNSGSYFDLITLPIQNKKVPRDFIGFPQTSNYISIEGPHFQNRSRDGIAFEHIKFLGSRSESGSVALRPYTAARKHIDMAEKAWLDYNIYVFNSSSQANVTVFINAGLDTDPDLPMKYSLTLGSSLHPANFTRVLSEPEVPSDTPEDWKETVADHVWVRTVSLGHLEPGKHTLRWQVNSPEVYLEKLVVWLQETPQLSYLGPPETKELRPSS